MTEAIATEAVVDTPKKRTVSDEFRIKKMRLTRDMLENNHEIAIANRDFALTRAYDDLLYMFNSQEEAIEFVKEAFIHKETEAQRRADAEIDKLMNDPVKREALERRMNSKGNSKVTAIKGASKNK